MATAWPAKTVLKLILLRPRQCPGGATRPRACSKLNKAWAEAKGTPLSLRMLEGRPRSLKCLFKHGTSVVFFGGGKSLTGEEITAGMIGDRQRVAVFMIARQELAHVIGAPEFIGSLA